MTDQEITDKLVKNIKEDIAKCGHFETVTSDRVSHFDPQEHRLMKQIAQVFSHSGYIVEQRTEYSKIYWYIQFPVTIKI